MNQAELIKIARKVGTQIYVIGDRAYLFYDKQLEEFAELIRADEREVCAKLCDDEARQSSSDHEAGGMYWCADAIRARGEK